MDELDRLAAICEEHDILAITDEIYEHILYDGLTHVPLASRARARDRTVTLSGLSKTFAITGWRIGYLTAPPEIARRITVLHDLLYVCAPTPLQHAVVAGLGMPDAYYTDLAASYARKREIFCSALADAGLTPYVPRGAYYVLADVRRLGFLDPRRRPRWRSSSGRRSRACRGRRSTRRPGGRDALPLLGFLAKEDDVPGEEASAQAAGALSRCELARTSRAVDCTVAPTTPSPLPPRKRGSRLRGDGEGSDGLGVA